MRRRRQQETITKNHAQLLTSDEVAALLKVTAGTLRQWRYLRKGPKFGLMGRKVRYRLEDVLDWQQKAIQFVDPIAL